MIALVKMYTRLLSGASKGIVAGVALAPRGPSMMRWLFVLLVLTCNSVVALGSEGIVGRASVIDGDTVEIHGTRIRLFGIDAPESGQQCRVAGKITLCGQQAAFALFDKIGTSTVNCEPRDRDRFNRIVAVCRLRGEDLGASMVAQGWAMAYREFSLDYVPQEAKAAAAKIGIWQGEFVAPWDWRKGKRLAGGEGQLPPQSKPRPPQQRASCLIKGNVSADGERVYHIPGGEFYDKTHIDTAKGERWFCTEAEARAAGWRRSKR